MKRAIIAGNHARARGENQDQAPPAGLARRAWLAGWEVNGTIGPDDLARMVLELLPEPTE